MSLRFRKASAVAVGTFNIYVIQPNWLAEVKLVPEGTPVKIEADFNRPGFRYVIEGQEMTWDVRPDRLIISSPSPSDDCGEILAGVLDKLPWTPLAAVGVNIEFVGGTSELKGIAGYSLPVGEPPEHYEIRQRTVHMGAQRGQHIFNAQLSLAKELELSINVHTDLKGKGSQAEVNRIAQETSRQFFALREESVFLAKHLFKNLEISNERHST